VTAPQFSVDMSSAPAPTVTAVGDIDLANVGEFRTAIEAAAAGNEGIQIDMTEVTYCDSAVVRVLFSTAVNTKLTLLVRAAGVAQTLFAISGLDRVTTVSVVD
jgi:anti-sigma B factor antagonist